LKEEAAKVWDSAAELGKRHGYRNAQVTVLAPTGTISFLMDCDTTGIEPDIALVKYKLLAGGGMLKIVNQTVKPGAGKTRLQLRGDRAHHRAHRRVRHDRGRDRRRRLNDFIRTKAGAFADLRLRVQAVQRRALARHYMAHLKMMAAAQPFLSGAISKTVNMPERPASTTS
jgi:ribonucleoside-diphosphate reductase alpha chain